ncbi:NINE protein [Rhodopirellula sallentina]|uniref:TM2 domain-containing protein n=1 Tax=Rhodopirellula sallentina SM41 TaxID=1263870 RepID=M5U8P6_9BACT|nr:NINE protein [Rhodopirellula sallentina]EMI54216.1 TM2 domain-containing protein [Rhodopirellula sallentina SM41]
MATYSSMHPDPYAQPRYFHDDPQDVDMMRNMEPTHPALLGYLFWVIGFTGAHRFYFGKPLTGALWFFTGGIFLIGWIIDFFFIPAMSEEAQRRYRPAATDYSVAWVLLVFLGVFGVHRFYMGKIVTGVIYLLTGGLLGIGYVYDLCTLNEQIDAG